MQFWVQYFLKKSEKSLFTWEKKRWVHTITLNTVQRRIFCCSCHRKLRTACREHTACIYSLGCSLCNSVRVNVRELKLHGNSWCNSDLRWAVIADKVFFEREIRAIRIATANLMAFCPDVLEENSRMPHNLRTDCAAGQTDFVSHFWPRSAHYNLSAWYTLKISGIRFITVTLLYHFLWNNSSNLFFALKVQPFQPVYGARTFDSPDTALCRT